MRIPKLLFAIAIVFAALSFSFKANAQADPEVVLRYADNNWINPTGENGYEWQVLLFNYDTSEDYYFDTWEDGHKIGYQEYRLGNVPEGNYVTYIDFYSYVGNWHNYIDWSVATNSDYMSLSNRSMTQGETDMMTDWGVSHPNNTLYVESAGGIYIDININ